MQSLDIVHIKQSEETSCGAAALAMVYQHLGFKDETESSVWERIKCERPNAPGEYYIETKSIAGDGQGKGLSFFIGQVLLDSVETALQPIREFLILSIPVIVCQRISEAEEWGHFRVVTGIDEKGIHLHDPKKDALETMDANSFMRLWQKSEKTQEVIGGQFIALFKKGLVEKDQKFLVTNFYSSIRSFSVSDLGFL